MCTHTAYIWQALSSVHYHSATGLHLAGMYSSRVRLCCIYFYACARVFPFVIGFSEPDMCLICDHGLGFGMGYCNVTITTPAINNMHKTLDLQQWCSRVVQTKRLKNKMPS